VSECPHLEAETCQTGKDKGNKVTHKFTINDSNPISPFILVYFQFQLLLQLST